MVILSTISVCVDEVFRQPPFHLSTMHVMTPFSFRHWVEKQRPSLASGRPIDMFGAQFETEVTQTQGFDHDLPSR